MPTPTLAHLLETGLTMLPAVGAAVIGGVRYHRLPPNLRALAWLAWFELPLEIVATSIGFMHGNNLFIMPFYTVGELWLLALVYGRTLQLAAFDKALPWLVGSFTAYTLVDSILAPDLTWFKPGQQVLQSLLLLGIVGLYFRELLLRLHVPRLEGEPMFWVSVGLALYFLGYLNIALFSNYMLKHYSMQLNRDIWAIHTGLYTLLHGCYCWALWRQPQRPAIPVYSLHNSA